MEPDRIAALPVFRCLSAEQLRALAPHAIEMRVARGGRLLLDGLFAYELLAIESGRAQVRLAGEWIAVLAPGDVFGALGRTPATYATATVAAVEDMTLVALSRATIRHLRGVSPATVDALVEFIGDVGLDGDHAPAEVEAVSTQTRSSTLVLSGRAQASAALA